MATIVVQRTRWWGGTVRNCICTCMRRCSSARRPARSCVTAAIWRARSSGGDATSADNGGGVKDLGEPRVLEVGYEFLAGRNGSGEGRRCGVGDSGDDARRRSGGGDGVIAGIGLGSRAACASSSCRRTGRRLGLSVRKFRVKFCITFSTRPAISCVSASFRAADCCNTRMAPSRESPGKGESTRGVGALS